MKEPVLTDKHQVSERRYPSVKKWKFCKASAASILHIFTAVLLLLSLANKHFNGLTSIFDFSNILFATVESV